jgi:site-specific recombinase XerD
MDIPSKHRSVPIQASITKIGRGYPDKLVIFQLPASPFWWVRYFTQGKIYKKSTKTTVQREAIAFAKTFYEDTLLRERNLLPLGNSPSFERCARELLLEQSKLIARGERNPLLNKHDEQMFKTDMLPHFQGMDIKQISFKHLDAYVSKIAERNLAAGTIKKHLNLLHKILTYAQREGLIDRLPTMPKVKQVDSPRAWFNQEQYEILRDTVKKLIQKKTVVRSHLITDELRYLITFLVNSFLRPGDIKLLRHRNIEIINKEQTYLRIQTEQSKTINSPVVTMEHAVGIYKDLLAHQQKNDRPCGPNDYLFFPHLPNRDFAIQTMRRQFDVVLDVAKLKHSSHGEPRTLYSLRHSAIMFRLTQGDNIDLLTLARNARTSVDIIDRFYAKPLQAEMNIEKIHSMRNKTVKKTKRTS